MDLRKTERNEIFRAVESGGLDPAECKLEKNGVSSGISLILLHDPTGSFFRFATTYRRHDQYTYGIRVGTDPVIVPMQNFSWAQIIKAIQDWSREVVDWIGIPDMWELRNRWRSLTDPQYGQEANTPFAPQEQLAISRQLAAISESIKKTHKLTAEQESRIEARLDEAEKASKRLGRKDWILLFAGGIFSLILTDVITPDVAQHILMMSVQGLEHLFSNGPRALSGPA